MVPATSDYRERFDRDIRELFRMAMKVAVGRPAQAAYFLRCLGWQQRAARRRARWAGKGVEVPALAIISITNRCNLACRGCYARVLREQGEQELDARAFGQLLAEARDLGIAIVMLAGGEPLVRPELLEIAAGFRDVVFPVFTNGLLIDEPFIARLRRQPNLIPVLSVEGYREETDHRRGTGVFAQLADTCRRLSEHGVFHGVSLTATSGNVDTISDEAFVSSLIRAGTRLFVFVEYVPVQSGTEAWVLTDSQRQRLLSRLDRFRQQLPGLFVAFPGDEAEYGGCLAAGRGFVHVSASGRVEPCPFAPYSDVSVGDVGLRAALASPLLRAIRSRHVELQETRGGCALWQKRDWVRSLVATGQGDPDGATTMPTSVRPAG